ncbi:uncharacterized protein LOC127602260 [Hippocampus zosterae]|uniref:uncharacterized protein LOC127602260 n=1 Tax=Hippocampus zosterae TaxID=109293 RepID=UPI00223DDB35|nr:uncharacterized protein LOC127602260 [Hippocampus zosterae]
MDDVTVTRTITIRANQKPWLRGEFHMLLRARNTAHSELETWWASGLPGPTCHEASDWPRDDIQEDCRPVQGQLRHQEPVVGESRLSQTTHPLCTPATAPITDYTPSLHTCNSSISLLNNLNDFFARFERDNTTPAQMTPNPPGDQVLTLSLDSVRRPLRRTNVRKAAGPDNIPGRVLRDCAEELTDVFTVIFNTSLSQAVVPTCLKATIIIPVPKKSSPSSYNDYRPVALTPILMKHFKRLVMQHIKSAPPPWAPTCLHIGRADQLPTPSPPPTTQPSPTWRPRTHTSECCSSTSAQHSTPSSRSSSSTNWTTWGSTQAVRVGSNTSGTIMMNKRAPHGYVLSPLLFTLLTHDCSPSSSSNLFVKFANDMTVVGLISNDDETIYRSEVTRLACGVKTTIST